MELTKDSEKLICVLYKAYLEKRKSGLPKSKAKSFGSSHAIHETFFPDLMFEDVDDTCRELSRAKLLNCFWADNIAFNVSISDQGIIYMENRFKDNILSVADFISKFIP